MPSMLDGPFRFLPAAALAAVTVATAPFMGLVRDWLFDLAGASAVKLLAGALGLIAVAVLVTAIARIRENRPPRYAALVGVAGLLILQTVALGTGSAKVDVVEKIHILQYGALAFLLYRALLPRDRVAEITTLVLPIIWAGLAGVADESAQGFFRFRVADIRDVWLNLLAAACGLLLALALVPPKGWRSGSTAPGDRSLKTTLRWLAVLVLVIGAFFDTVHLGHMVDDDEIGRFRSWFSQQELLALSEDRAARWPESPPGDRAWNRKDFYLWEAARHANHRNASYKAGHWTLAWQANRILERYYGPFLDLPEYRGAGRHRYLPATHEKLRNKATPDPRTYLSDVQKGVVFVWPRGLFIAAVLSLAAFLGSLSVRPTAR